MRAEDLVELVEKRGLVGLQDQLGISRQRAESLDVEARRLVASGFEQSKIGRSLAASAIARQRDRGPSTRPTSPDVDKVLRALDRMEAGPTGDELASRMEADRRRDVEARNAVGAAESRRYAQQLKRGGYAGWAEGQR
jgi:hypothetical protein